MKRETYCMTCKKRVQGVINEESLPPGEHVKYVDGQAISDMLCDFCGVHIKPKTPCCAFSNYIDGRAPYYPWESLVIKPISDDTEPSQVDKDPEYQLVYRLLITGTDEQLLGFHVAASMVLNFLERRLQTVMATCMNESLEFARAAAEKYNVTLQYIKYENDEGEGQRETYPVIHQGDHARWEKGGYLD